MMHSGEDCMWLWMQILELCSYKPRNTKDYWWQPEARRYSLALSTPWLCTWSIQNCRRVNFYCFKACSWWYLVSTSLRIQYRRYSRSTIPSKVKCVFKFWLPFSNHGFGQNLCLKGFLGGSDSKETACNVGDLGLIPGLGRSPGEGNVHSSILAWRIPWTEETGRL